MGRFSVGRVLIWPLAKDVSAEVRVTSLEINPAHLERLRQYLDAKAALEADDEVGA